jgi:prepilin-type N-terminal cleavage/methylation domain-containing protein
MLARRPGFTLAEVLIAVALLGIIAMFVVPKLLSIQTMETRRVVFKESAAAISQVFYTALQNGELDENTSSTYFVSHLNGLKKCIGNSSAEGCWDLARQGPIVGGPEHTEPGVVLANNAQIVGINNFFRVEDSVWAANGHGLINAFAIDWNGVAGPNTLGDDQLQILYCGEPPGRSCTFFDNTLRGGQLGAYINTTLSAAENKANSDLFDDIFLN